MLDKQNGVRMHVRTLKRKLCFFSPEGEKLVRAWEGVNQVLIPLQKVIEYLIATPDDIFVEAMVFFHRFL